MDPFIKIIYYLKLLASQCSFLDIPFATVSLEGPGECGMVLLYRCVLGGGKILVIWLSKTCLYSQKMVKSFFSKVLGLSKVSVLFHTANIALKSSKLG